MRVQYCAMPPIAVFIKDTDCRSQYHCACVSVWTVCGPGFMFRLCLFRGVLVCIHPSYASLLPSIA